MQAGGAAEWALPEGWRLEHPLLEGEELVAGVYLRLLLRHPGFPLREPRTTLQVLPRLCMCAYVCVLFVVEDTCYLFCSFMIFATIPCGWANNMNHKHRGEGGHTRSSWVRCHITWSKHVGAVRGFQVRVQGLLEAYVKEAASRPAGPQRAALLAAAACQVHSWNLLLDTISMICTVTFVSHLL